MPKYKTLMYSSHDGLLLCFRGLRDELQELNGEAFPVGTVLNITEEDTDRTKTFAITNLEPFSYDNTPYSETVRFATTDDIRVLHNRIDKLEERIHSIKRLDEQQLRIDEIQKQIDELTTKCKAMWEYIQINCSSTSRR